MNEMVEIDVSGAKASLKKANVNVAKGMPKIVARLSLKGEKFMGQSSIAPHRTGTLRRGIHAHPTFYPVSIAVNVKYAFYANVRSKKPHFIEKTYQHILNILPKETDIVINNALRRMNL